MQNAGLTIGMVAIGLGLASIGFNLNGNQANATPAAPVAFNQGPDLPTIVWYGMSNKFNNGNLYICRAWSDGTVEGMSVIQQSDCDGGLTCKSDWFVINHPSDGMRLAGDIDGNGEVSGSDLGIVLNEFGLTEPGTFPPSDCPLGLIP